MPKGYQVSHTGKRQAGAALFLILIAVALFAALSYVITSTSDDNASVTSNREQTELLTSRFLQHMSLVEVALNRMILSGIPEDSIVYGTVANKCPTQPSVVSAPGWGAACTPFCQTGANCLFTSDGGGVPREPGILTEVGDATNSGLYFSGSTQAQFGAACMWTESGPGIGTAAVDMTAHYWRMKREVCLRVNQLNGINGIPETSDWLSYTLNGSPFDLTGRTEYCTTQTGSNIYDYTRYILIK